MGYQPTISRLLIVVHLFVDRILIPGVIVTMFKSLTSMNCENMLVKSCYFHGSFSLQKYGNNRHFHGNEMCSNKQIVMMIAGHYTISH